MKNFLEELIKKITKKNIKFATHMSIVLLYLLFILTILISTIVGTSLILYFLLEDYLYENLIIVLSLFISVPLCYFIFILLIGISNIFENIGSLQNVYLAGGEPMLMKENIEFLKLLKEKNPNCSIRVNTNLSTTQTGIFDLLCEFKNIHWTVSVEAIENEYEYIRYHGSWNDFQKNLQTINKLDHKISFNMLHFILNHASLFACVDYLRDKGFHDNSFIIGPLYTPRNMNILNLPGVMLDKVVERINKRLDDKPSGYLKNSYENLLAYYSNTPWKKNIQDFLVETEIRDKRRGTDCRTTFPKLFEELDAYTLE